MAKFIKSDRQTLLPSWSAWVPIPLFLMSVLVLMFLDIEAVHEPKFLIATLNLVFSTGVSLMIVAVAVRSYRSCASGPVLLLGCGMLTFGMVSAIAGALVAVGAINAAITIYNCGVLATAGLHLVSVLWALTPHGGLITRHTSLLLILSFVLTAMGLVALNIAMAQESLPHFFEQGHGATAIRQVVLGTAIGIFTLTSVLFGILNLQVRSAFLRWYALGLALIAIGLLGVYPIRSTGSLLNWVGRCSQYVGGLYLLVGMWRSISERGSWELPLGLLREIQGRYQRLVELLPDAIVVHRDGVYLFANSSAARLLHASSPSEIIGMAVLATVAPEDRAEVLERMRLATTPGKPTPLRDFRMLRLDGTRVLVETTATSIEFGGRSAALVMIRDITDRKLAEAAVRETEEHLTLALRNAPIVLFRQDRDLRYTWIYQPQDNFSEDDILGKTDTDLLPPESAAKLMAEKKKVLDTGDHIHTSVSYRVKGRMASYSLTIEPMRDPHGAIIGISCAAMDVTEQEQNRIALREANEISERHLAKLNAVLNQMTEGLVLFDPEGNLLDMNPAALAIHGFESNVDLLRHQNDLTTIFELHSLDGDVLPVDQWPIALALRGETFSSFEVQVRRLDIGKHWIASYGGTPVYDHDGNQVLAIVTLRNITLLKKAQEALQRSEARWNAVIENLVEGIIIATEDEQVIHWNPAARRMHGFKHSNEGLEPLEKIPTTFQLWTMDGIHMLELDSWPMRRIKRGEIVRHLELRLRRPDQGWEKVVSYSGAMVDTAAGERLIFLSVSDLTRQRTAEQSLRESEERLRLATDAAQLGVFEWDAQNDIVFWHNPRMFEIFGLSLQDRPLDREQLEHEVIHPDDLFRFQREIIESMQNRTPFTGKYRIRRFNDGQWRWIESLGTFEYAENGDTIRLLSVLSDITNRKQAEEQINASLAEKEVLLKEIHHRVKNNLQVISSLISLQADTLTDERIREELNDVRDRVRSMALVHEKLYQTKDMASLDFAEYATSLMHALWRSHSTLSENVQLNLAVEPVSLSIEAAVPCGLILNELAGNALKHAFPNNSGGEVEVGLKIDPATKVVCLRVCDNGVGLPAGLDWNQLKSLGLRLVKILAGQVRGTVETATGSGTEIKIIFPLKKNKHE